VRALALLLLIVAAPVLSAQSGNGSAPAVRLTVRPVLCVLDARTPRCDMSFVVSWQSERSGYYCLFNDFEAAPLKCWTGERSGELVEKRVVEDEFDYWMTAQDGEERVAAVTVEVLQVDDGDRRRRRRSRHVWDLL
jgi:hypothetical protein